MTTSEQSSEFAVSLLTGGGDRPYAFGISTELMSKGITLDIIGSDELDCPEFHDKPRVRFLNLRGSQRTDAGFSSKLFRVVRYYARLIRYATTAKHKIFHILWNNKFAFFDRTLLTLYYKLLGKKIVLTVHNVNAARRDSTDTWLNRLTLRIQYSLSDHIFVHTDKMKLELLEDFGQRTERISVIPFGINNAIPHTALTTSEARHVLNIGNEEKTILFFGNITPYKGLEYLVSAFQQVATGSDEYRLIIAGTPKGCQEYWNAIQDAVRDHVQRGQILLRAAFIPDNETELYFKAADVLVLPYRHIYQSGVLLLGYSFGLPVIVTDVGSLKDAVIVGKTGFVCEPEDSAALAETIKEYFASDLFTDLSAKRSEISAYASEQHSWDKVGQMTVSVYADLLRMPSPEAMRNRNSSDAALDGQSIA